MGGASKMHQEYQQVKKIFKQVIPADSEGKRSIATEDLTKIFHALRSANRQSPWRNDDLETLYSMADKNADGRLNCSELLDWLFQITESPKKSPAGKHASLGVLRLDYDYPPAPGDVDSPDSYAYDVYYRCVPGFTFSMCMSGKLTPDVEEEFIEAVKWLDAKGVSGITGDCGFMLWFQQLARKHTHKPVFMSSLCHLPAITCAFASQELIAIFTANGKTLRPMRNLIKDECGVDEDERRYIIVGCENVPGFEAVATGDKVDTAKVQPGVVKLAQDTLRQYPAIRAILMECTELGPYSDALRQATGLPVFDSITNCDFFIRGCLDNPRTGLQNWQNQWDGKQDAYVFGQNLSAADRADLVNQAGGAPAPSIPKAPKESKMYRGKKANAPALGILRLDYNYPPAVGDIDHPDSFPYDVYYRAVPGFTFEVCQSGVLTPRIEAEFVEALKWLEAQGVCAITGDCGFMMWFQKLARRHTRLPILMSSLAQLPAVTAAYSLQEKIAVFTANGKTLEPMRDLIRDECAVDVGERRYIFVGCEDVPGFEQVAVGGKVDLAKVGPGVVKKAQALLKQHPDIRAFLFECTELPAYSDSVRAATGLPVWDSLTCADLFVNGFMDNPLYGLNGWQEKWDGVQQKYEFGMNLNAADRARLQN